MLLLQSLNLIRDILNWIIWASSQKWFSPILNIFTVTALVFTAWEAFKSSRASSEANNLKLLPLLAIYFHYRQRNGHDTFTIKNLGEGVAYNITIYPWTLIFQDTQEILEINMSTTGTNILSKNDEKEISLKATINGSDSNIDPDMLHYFLKGFSATIQIEFKDAAGRECFTQIITTEHGVRIVLPTRRIGMSRKIDNWYGMHIQRNIKLGIEKFLWKYEERQIREHTPNYLIRILNILRKKINP